MMRQLRRRAAKLSLVFIAIIFLSSSFIRMGMGITQAFAAQSGDNTGPPEAIVKGNEDKDISELFRILKRREETVKRREEALDKQAEALATARAEIDATLAELIEAEEALRTTIALADGAAEMDLARLTQVYENMKPKDAAILFQQMDPKFAAGFLARMKPLAAAQILTGMPAEDAYAVSLILASRNASVPTD